MWQGDASKTCAWLSAGEQHKAGGGRRGINAQDTHRDRDKDKHTHAHVDTHRHRAQEKARIRNKQTWSQQCDATAWKKCRCGGLSGFVCGSPSLRWHIDRLAYAASYSAPISSLQAFKGVQLSVRDVCECV